MYSKIISANGIDLHYLENNFDNDPDKETIILMHGLTANAYSFHSIIEKMTDYHVLSVDLRGRGLSDKPDQNYSMEDHAKDIIGVMDALDLKNVIIGGHSFGARLSIYLSAKYPARFSKVILMDAAAKLHPDVKEMIGPSMMRLGKIWPSFDAYLQQMKGASYLDGQWSEEYVPFFKADIKKIDKGKVTTRSSLQHMLLAIEGVMGPGEKWMDYISNMEHPTLLINAIGAYVNGEAILPEELALETVHRIPHCQYQQVSGNHMTMLFGKGAEEIVKSIVKFINN